MSFKIALSVCLIVCLPSFADAQTAPQPVPRTAWGAPDLQGVYDFGTATPFQRPAELAGRAEFTPEEAAVQEQINAAQFAEGLNTENLTPPNYNNFWFDNGSGILPTRQSSLIVDPPDGRIPARTPQWERKDAAEQAAGGYPVRLHFGGIGVDGPEDRGLGERCLLGFNSGPPVMPSAYNNYLQVFQTPDHVVILTEMVHEVRIVPLDGRDRLSRKIPQWLGDGRGRWEGDTLVIETENFRPDRGMSMGGRSVGPSERMKLTERLTRVDEGYLLYEYTYDDAEVYTSTFSVSIPLRRTDNAVFEYACHEGNYGLLNILEGARAEEAAAGP
jgi:hypothetical protein